MIILISSIKNVYESEVYFQNKYLVLSKILVKIADHHEIMIIWFPEFWCTYVVFNSTTFVDTSHNNSYKCQKLRSDSRLI